jgi:hypothetical protein
VEPGLSSSQLTIHVGWDDACSVSLVVRVVVSTTHTDHFEAMLQVQYGGNAGRSNWFKVDRPLSKSSKASPV